MLNKNLLVDIEQGGIKDIRLQGTELFQNVKEGLISGSGVNQEEVLGCIQETELFQNIIEENIGGYKTGVEKIYQLTGN